MGVANSFNFEGKIKRSKVPRLSDHYRCWAEYLFERGMEHSLWFYLLAAYFYEAEDEEMATASTADLVTRFSTEPSTPKFSRALHHS